MKTLLNVIAGLLLLVQSWQRKKEQEDAQAQADSINKDPVDWFNGHFSSGLQQQPADADSSGKATHISIPSK